MKKKKLAVVWVCKTLHNYCPPLLRFFPHLSMNGIDLLTTKYITSCQEKYCHIITPYCYWQLLHLAKSKCVTKGKLPFQLLLPSRRIQNSKGKMYKWDHLKKLHINPPRHFSHIAGYTQWSSVITEKCLQMYTRLLKEPRIFPLTNKEISCLYA